MILSTFFFIFYILIIKCVKSSSGAFKIPLLKGQQQSIDSILQGLYHLCPLRQKIFESTPSNEVYSPLHLVFAKMYYDLENGVEIPTDSSIYFKDSYSKTAIDRSEEDPLDFYSWTCKSLLSSQKYRHLLQWNLQTCRKTLETNTETVFEEQHEIIRVDTSKTSLQGFLDSLIEPEIEQLSVIFNGEESNRSVEIKREFAQIPEIPSFYIAHSPETEFRVEETVNLFDGAEYTLTVVILKTENGNFSVCLRDKASGKWFKIESGTFEEINSENVLLSASKHGQMVFYTKKNVPCNSSKPSHQLIIECLTKYTIHGIAKTVHSASSLASAPSSPLKPLTLPVKSKNMMLDSQKSYTSLTADNSPASAFKSKSVLSLQSLQDAKTPPPGELLAHLESILVPEDTSKAQMKLITSGSFEAQPEPVILERPASSAKNHAARTSERKRSDSFDDFEQLTGKFGSSQDVELDYFEDFPQRNTVASRSAWSTHYLKQPAREAQRDDLFVGLSYQEYEDADDFDVSEWGFLATRTEQNSHEKAAAVVESTEVIEDVYMHESLANLRKTRQFPQQQYTYQQYNPQQQHLLVQKKPNAFSNGLFTRSKLVIPITEDPEIFKSTAAEATPQSSHDS